MRLFSISDFDFSAIFCCSTLSSNIACGFAPCNKSSWFSLRFCSNCLLSWDCFSSNFLSSASLILSSLFISAADRFSFWSCWLFLPSPISLLLPCPFALSSVVVLLACSYFNASSQLSVPSWLTNLLYKSEYCSNSFSSVSDKSFNACSLSASLYSYPDKSSVASLTFCAQNKSSPVTSNLS